MDRAVGFERWAMVLGVSSGFGAATALALARDGYGIVGVHLDTRRTLDRAEAARSRIAAVGVPVVFHNVNAANDDDRARVIADTSERFHERRTSDADPFIAVVMHSLAFGTLIPYVASDGDPREVSRKQLEMTMDVMAHSLIYWVRDLFRAGFLRSQSRIFAMTSEGAVKAVPTYGPISAAKAALEAHCRQLALELIPHGITVNAIRAGVTDTPSARAIPGHEELFAAALTRNPGGRMTEPEDVAEAIVALSSRRLGWMTGNTIGVDGGERIGERGRRED